MKKNLRLHLLTLATLPLCSANAADLLWDGGTANIATNGDGVSTYTGGTWSAAISNWDAGIDTAHVAWNSGDSAIFAGTYATGTKTVAIGSNVTVNQIKINTGSTSGNRYDIGASSTQNDFAITFSGTYDEATPAISGTTSGFLNTNFNAKITGAVAGGLVIKHGSNITTPGSSGRLSFTNANSDFTGDVVLAGGNLAATSAAGAASNKLVLKGGALFVSGGAGTSTVTRNVVVASASGIATNSTGVGQILEFTGAISGSGLLTRYSNSLSGSNSSEVRLSGDMSGFTGTVEGTGNNANAIIAIQTTVPSGGAWKLSGSGSLKLNTTDNTHIADGPGKSDLLMNGGSLNLNGKNETINGLSGTTGIVQNQLAATMSTLTLGAGDATASFGGTIRDNSGTGGTLALTKTGSGTQTLGSDATFTGATTIEGGSLVLGGKLELSPVTVKSGAALTVATAGRDVLALTLEGGSKLSAPLDAFGNYLRTTNALTFSGGTVTLKPTFTEAPALGSYDFIVASGGITGSTTFVTDFSGGASRISGSAQILGNAVQVTVNTLGAALTWNNQAGTGTWELNAGANFLNGASNDVFKQYDAVTFGPSSPAGTITLNGTLLPTSVTVASSNNFTFSGTGSIGGVASLTKSGSGILTVANANTFTGDTIVSGGTLAVTGSLGNTEVLVESGGTLTGTGTIGGPVIIEGTVSPGSSVGTLALGTGSVGLSGTYACDIDGATSDLLAVTGNLDLTDATLTLNIVSPPTKSFHVIATYTGSLSGNFASVPEGYIVDTSEAGKVTLRPTPSAPLAGTITFEENQGYPLSGEVAGVSTDTNGTPYSGVDGWSLAGAAGKTHTTGSSGEYLGGQSIGCSTSGTFVSGRMGGIQRTGPATLTFDALWVGGGTAVGFMKDTDHDGLFDTTHPSGGVPGTGISFGIGGSPARFQYRDAGFGAEHPAPVLTGIAGHWYRYSITIGDSIGGSRTITWAMRDLTTGTGLDFNTATPEIDNWTFTVTDAQFGTAPEKSDGLWVRATSAARIDNIYATSAEPPPATAYDTWMDSFPSLTGDDRLADADPDHDGVKNLLEFVLNGNPTTSDSSILPTSSVSGGNLTFSFNRRDDSEGLVGQTVQYGDNLASWTNVIIGAVDGSSGGATFTVAENGAAPDLITVTIPTGSSSKKFVRLLVEESAP